MSKPVLLVVDDSEEFLGSMSRLLRREYDVRCARSREEAMRLLTPLPDVVLLDLRLDDDDPDNYEGRDLLRELRERFPGVPVLMITAYGDIDIAVECMKLGAVDFIQKSRADVNEIRTRLMKALEYNQLSRRVEELEREIQLVEPRKIVGASPKMMEVKRMIEAVAQDGRVTVLIRGETGTGKELVARAIHRQGWRCSKPFVPVALSVLSADLIAPELFGYEPGAFTDARERHIGYIEKAHGGVLFLDEIGDLDINVQTKLLRFLEERTFQRLGSTEPITVDVQIIAATNANLEEKVKEGKFREDLYFRLKVHEIYLPPLRERPEDIPLLVEHFLKLFRRQGKRIAEISPDALEVLKRCPWPGNVRQLRNALESAIFWAEYHGRERIEIDDLPADVRGAQINKAEPAILLGEHPFNLDEALARVELAYIEEALRTSRGKKGEAWKVLGLRDRFALRRRVKRLLRLYPNLMKEFVLVQRLYLKEEGAHED